MAGRAFIHTSSVKAVVFTHDSPNDGGSIKIDVSGDVIAASFQKTLKGEGTFTLTLSPNRDRPPTREIKDSHNPHSEYFRYLQPNDMVHVYFSNGTKYAPPAIDSQGRRVDPGNSAGGFHKQVVGYIDRVMSTQVVNADGGKTSTITITGTDFTKCWSKSSIYYNPNMSSKEAFGASIGGLKLKSAGIPLNFSPADMSRFLIFRNTAATGQFELPEAYLREINPDLLRRAEDVQEERIERAKLGYKDTFGVSFHSMAVQSGMLAVTANREFSKVNISDAIASNVQALSMLGFDSSGKDLLASAINDHFTLAHFLDLSYIEDLYVRGFKFSQYPSEMQGTIYSLMQTLSDPMLNESFFDLRYYGRDSFDVVVEQDDLSLNEGAPVYVPAFVLREYPFATGKVHPAAESYYSSGKLDVTGILDRADSLQGKITESITTSDIVATTVFGSPNAKEDLEYLLRAMFFNTDRTNEQVADQMEAVGWILRNRVTLSRNRGNFRDTYKEEAVTNFPNNSLIRDSSSVLDSSDKISDWAFAAVRGSSERPIDIAERVLSADILDDITAGGLYFVRPMDVSANEYIDYRVVFAADSTGSPISIEQGQLVADLHFEAIKRRASSSVFLNHNTEEGKDLTLSHVEGGSEIEARIVNEVWMPLSDVVSVPGVRVPTPEDVIKDQVTLKTEKDDFITVDIVGGKVVNTDFSYIGATHPSTGGLTLEPSTVLGLPFDLITVFRVKTDQDLSEFFNVEPREASSSEQRGVEGQDAETVLEAERAAVNKVSEDVVDLTDGVFFRDRYEQGKVDSPTALVLANKLTESQKDRTTAPVKFLKELQENKGLSRRFVDSVVVDRDEVIEETLSRSDAEHINLEAIYTKQLYHTHTAQLFFQDFLPIMSEIGFRRNGLRIHQETTDWYEAVFVGDGRLRSINRIYLEASLFLDLIHQHNMAYVSGVIHMRGRPDVRVGYRLDYDLASTSNPDGLDLSFYIEGVEHNYSTSPDTGETSYTTTVTVTRGQPNASDDRYPYVPPNWFLEAVARQNIDLEFAKGRDYKDVYMSQIPYRSSKDVLNRIARDPQSAKSFRPLPNSRRGLRRVDDFSSVDIA